MEVGAGVGVGQPEGDGSPAGPAHLGQQLDLAAGALLVDAVLGAEHGGGLEHPPPPTPERVRQGDQLLDAGEGAGYLPAVGQRVQDRAGGADADRAPIQRLVHVGGHGRQLVGRGRHGRVEAGFAHHVPAHRAVADHPRHVEPLGQTVQGVEVVAVGLPVPGQAAEDRRRRDVLDRFHHLGQPGPVLGPAGGEGHPAVADDHRGHAVPGRRGGLRVPAQLGIEVGVGVDEPGRDRQTVSLDGPSPRRLDGAHGDDAVAVDGHVGGPSGRPRAVDHPSPTDDEIVHVRDASGGAYPRSLALPAP